MATEEKVQDVGTRQADVDLGPAVLVTDESIVVDPHANAQDLRVSIERIKATGDRNFGQLMIQADRQLRMLQRTARISHSIETEAMCPDELWPIIRLIYADAVTTCGGNETVEQAAERSIRDFIGAVNEHILPSVTALRGLLADGSDQTLIGDGVKMTVKDYARLRLGVKIKSATRSQAESIARATRKGNFAVYNR